MADKKGEAEGKGKKTPKRAKELAARAEKMVLSAADVAEAQAAHSAAVADFLAPAKPRANVRGIAFGIKWTNGEPTGEPALLALVTHKADRAGLSKADLVPSKVEGVQTDVLAIGEPFALGTGDAAVQALAKRARPAKGGYSVGHISITAGTLGTCVYDLLPEGTTHDGTGAGPRHGIGIPSRYYILSNNHVLANSNGATINDPIVQPGPLDGGTDPADRIARLSRFIPITFEPPVPRDEHRNLVDAAVGEGDFHDLDREIFWTGHVSGWRRREGVTVGQAVRKTGRTTSFTTGRITAIAATVDVNFGGGRVARFVDQLVATNMSAPGDSGSVITTLDSVAVGLLFAGSPVATIANQIEYVRSLLRVEVAERIL